MGARRESGASTAEYGLLLAAVAVMIVFVVSALGLVSAGTLGSVRSSMDAQQAAAGRSPREALQVPPTLATTVRAGRRCAQHGATAQTAAGLTVRCAAGPGGVYRWRAA